jgi:hypothetical protein
LAFFAWEPGATAVIKVGVLQQIFCAILLRRESSRETMGDLMSLFLVMPILAATGLYNPQVVDRHHHCIAEPGTVEALYCPAPAAATPPHHSHVKR